LGKISQCALKKSLILPLFEKISHGTVQKSLKLNFFFWKTLGLSHRGEKVLKKGPKNQVFEKKTSQRQCLSNKKAVGDSAYQIEKLSEIVLIK